MHQQGNRQPAIRPQSPIDDVLYDDSTIPAKPSPQKVTPKPAPQSQVTTTPLEDETEDRATAIAPAAPEIEKAEPEAPHAPTPDEVAKLPADTDADLDRVERFMDSPDLGLCDAAEGVWVGAMTTRVVHEGDLRDFRRATNTPGWRRSARVTALRDRATEYYERYLFWRFPEEAPLFLAGRPAAALVQSASDERRAAGGRPRQGPLLAERRLRMRYVGAQELACFDEDPSRDRRYPLDHVYGNRPSPKVPLEEVDAELPPPTPDETPEA